MTLSRDFKGIWIPKEIWIHPGLSKMSVILWAEIHSLYSPKHGGCYASNDYLCEFLGVKERQLQKYLRELKDAGLLTQKSFNGRFRILFAEVPQYIPTQIDADIEESECGADPHYNAGQRCTKVRGRGALKCAPTIYKNKEEIKDKNIAQSRTSCGREQRLDFFFSQDTGHFEEISLKDKNDWKIAFPSIDVGKEVVKAEQWLKANPSKAKKKLWRKFLVGWFTRANDKAENQAAYRSNNASGGKVDRRTLNTDGSPVESPVDGLF